MSCYSLIIWNAWVYGYECKEFLWNNNGTPHIIFIYEWTGSNNLFYLPFFSVDVDECNFADICENNGTCQNTAGSYKCDCSEGWQGKHCKEGDLNIVKYYFKKSIKRLDGKAITTDLP